MKKTILVTGIGGLTPRSLATIIKEKHPDYKIIGCDIDKQKVSMPCIYGMQTFIGVFER